MRSILSLLGLSGAESQDSRDTQTVRRISEQLDRLPPEEARYVAAFAYILARVARADLDFSEDEVVAMERVISETTHLAPPQAALAVQIARHQATLQGGTEDYLVTRQFREMSDRSQRLELVRALFAVGAADGSISQQEDQTIAQVGSELGLTAREVAACRGAFREHLAVLQGLPGTDAAGRGPTGEPPASPAGAPTKGAEEPPES